MTASPERYPRRLIEVDLPIARISAHARREKSIRHGHISTLHIWWARRPLAACRAVICAALWPDPGDELCPESFVEAATKTLYAFAEEVATTALGETCDVESRKNWESVNKREMGFELEDSIALRDALLHFIADFANWDNSTVPEYLETSRALTQAAHESLGGEGGTRPLVVDPFAGGGSIPLEALRVGADAFASDLNPVAVLLNKVVLEYIPKYGRKLADEVRKWGQWVKEQAEKELAAFYPKDPDGSTPIAYLWARTIQCEGFANYGEVDDEGRPVPERCGAEVPLMRSLWLAKKEKKSVALRIVPNPDAKRVEFEIIRPKDPKDGEPKKPFVVGNGTVKRGSATCPCCGHTTPVKSVREQLKQRRGGAADARLFCVVTTRSDLQGRFYRLPTDSDLAAIAAAAKELEKRKKAHTGTLSLVPDEVISLNEIRRVNVPMYGMTKWGDLFTPRQSLALSVFAHLVNTLDIGNSLDEGLAIAVKTSLTLGVGRLADRCSSACRWDPTPTASGVINTFSRQAIPLMWDFAEGLPLESKSGGWSPSIEWISLVAIHDHRIATTGVIAQSSATNHPLPDGLADALITDPPYYYSVPYSDLSDYFYVWMKRSIHSSHNSLFTTSLTPKEEECVQNLPHSEYAEFQKNRAFYEMQMGRALSESNRITRRDGISVVVFAHSETDAWESLVSALVGGRWTVTASWPIDTEMGSRVLAQRQRTLASSVHLVCRPRVGDEIGDWRDVLAELPQRMHAWMPRLASEGVVGADAIFACLGPALEIFSRYARVDKSNGDPVTLKEYLEHVWAAVSKEALSTIFRDAEASSLEPDARLTAIWLWTIGGGKSTSATESPESEEEAEADTAEDEEDEKPKALKAVGFTLEFDAARKIAQGLGIHLEKNESLVEVKGDKARLLAVAERTKHLFGKAATTTDTKVKKAKKKAGTPSLFAELDEMEVTEKGTATELKAPPPGTTVLDRVHQAMILFGGQRGELLKRFLVEDGIGKDARFWKLAQSLAALYPTGTDERRWVEGVLARKKGLGL